MPAALWVLLEALEKLGRSDEILEYLQSKSLSVSCRQ